MTHLERVAVDLDLARAQWEGYVAALHDAGWQTIEVPPRTSAPTASSWRTPSSCTATSPW